MFTVTKLFVCTIECETIKLKQIYLKTSNSVHLSTQHTLHIKGKKERKKEIRITANKRNRRMKTLCMVAGGGGWETSTCRWTDTTSLPAPCPPPTGPGEHKLHSSLTPKQLRFTLGTDTHIHAHTETHASQITLISVWSRQIQLDQRCLNGLI